MICRKKPMMEQKKNPKRTNKTKRVTLKLPAVFPSEQEKGDPLNDEEELIEFSTTGTIRDDLPMTEGPVILVIPIGGDAGEFS